MLSNHFLSWTIVVGLAAALSGCGAGSSYEKQSSAEPAENAAQQGPAGQGEAPGKAGHQPNEHRAGQNTSAENSDQGKTPSLEAVNGLAELSDADAALAAKQRTCPVSGDVLGAMGKPYKVTVQGKTIFLCCPGCEREIRKNPDKYLAAMEKGMVDGRKSLPVQGE
jgi:YHS domain-containing protein